MDIGTEYQVKQSLAERGLVGSFSRFPDGLVLQVRNANGEPLWEAEHSDIVAVLDYTYPDWSVVYNKPGARFFTARVRE